MPDIYEDLARSYLGKKRYVFPTSRRCRVSDTAAVLVPRSPFPLWSPAPALFPDLAGEKQFKDIADWYLAGAAERAAAPQVTYPDGPASEPEPALEALPESHHQGGAFEVTAEFLAAAPDFPDLVAPIPEADPEGYPL